MEFVGGILLGLIAIIVLAAIGVTTVAALALMVVLGFLTEMSFRRLFFVSFGLGLLAPILLTIGIGSSLDDENFQRELQSEIRETLPGSESLSSDIREAIPQVRELQQQLEDGAIEPEEFSRELERLIEESAGVRIEIDPADLREAENSIQIESD